MFYLPTECTDGTSCDGLRTANAMLWSAVAVFFLMAVVQSYILLVVVLSVAPEHLAQWQEDHRYFTHSPTGLFIMGLTTMYIALGLHIMFISLDATYTMQVRYTVCGIILVCSFAFGWVYWALVSKLRRALERLGCAECRGDWILPAPKTDERQRCPRQHALLLNRGWRSNGA